jgi:TonB-dependent starch-binding outer membrane protein SusC
MKKILMMFVLALATTALALGQTVHIRGTVTSSEDGLGIPGVSITVKGTTLGVMSDNNGKYLIDVPSNYKILTFSFVGMKTQEVDITDKTTVDVVLEPEMTMMDEVVVVGYGVQSKRDVSGSISTVKGDDIKMVPVQSFDQALQGKATGVNITVPNGVLNNPPVIRIRGVNSISSSAYPLIIVDGVAVFTGDLSSTHNSANALSDINPEDIASMEVLKDASATAIYGSRAANGVILITTKKGTVGKTKVSYDGYVGFTEPYHLFDMMNAKEYLAHKNLARRNYYIDQGKDPDAASSVYFSLISNPAGPAGNYVDTDWAKEVYRKGFQQNHALTISGANEKTSYFLSVGYTDQQGMVKKNSFTRKNVRVNLDHKIAKIITVGANFSYVNSLGRAPNTGSLVGEAYNTAGAGRLAFVTSPLVGPYNFDGTYNINGQYIGNMGSTQPEARMGYYNPVAVMNLCKYTSQSDRFTGSIYATIEPIKGITFKTLYGLDNVGIESISFDTPVTGDGYPTGDATNYFNRMKRWTWTNTANLIKSINEKININFLVGEEEQYTDANNWYGEKQGVADVFFETYQGSWTTSVMGGGTQGENYFISYFSRLNVDLNKKYFIEGSLRRDGFSGLSKGNKYGMFGGASAMWNVSSEKFFADSPLGELFSDFRLKASYGRVGNMSGVGNYSSLFLYSSSLYGTSPTLYFSQAGNADLKWETSDKYDLGVNMSVFKDRIQLGINYFYNNINGLILDTPQSPSKGIPGNTIPQNIGRMVNSGVEISVTSYNINKNKFQWTTTLNLSTLKNEVKELAPGVDFISGVTSDLETANRTLVGKPIGMLYGVKTRGVDPTTGRRILVNGNGDEVLYTQIVQTGQSKWTYRKDGTTASAVNVSNSGKCLGSPLPKIYGGLDNTFRYGKLDAAINLTFALDFYVYNGSKAGLRDQRFWNNSMEVYNKSWKKAGDVTHIPRPVYSDNLSNGSALVISENVERGDFVKVRSLSLGYTFNKFPEVTGIEKIRVYAQAFNAFVFTKYTGSDPEVSTNGDSNLAPGVDRNTVPQARTYTFGINITF